MRIGARGHDSFVPEFAGRMPRTPMTINLETRIIKQNSICRSENTKITNQKKQTNADIEQHLKLPVVRYLSSRCGHDAFEICALFSQKDNLSPRTRRFIHLHLPRNGTVSPGPEADLLAQLDTDDNADSMREAYDTEGRRKDTPGWRTCVWAKGSRMLKSDVASGGDVCPGISAQSNYGGMTTRLGLDHSICHLMGR